ncbi:MAG: ABC transporter permease [Actinobacteria bacterium]|nr:ABC transporter permease [Actinomycetota bacterium]
MSARRILVLAKKSLNPRNPYLVFAFLAPFFYAAVFQFVFNLGKDEPRLAVYEEGEPRIVSALEGNQGLRLTVAESGEDLRRLVEEKKVDVGAIIDREDLERLEAGEEATLEIYVNGESLARNRSIALASLMDALRGVSPGAPRVRVETVRLGEERPLSVMEMFLPFIIIIVIVVGAYFLPASFLVTEKERRTLEALLVTPVSLAEVLVAFGLTGLVISLGMGIVLLLLTVGIPNPPLVLSVLFLGSVLAGEWGLIMGLASRDQTSMVAYMKSINIFIVGPVLFVIFPSWPQWIARLFPTYYIANPIFRVAIYGEGWKEVGWQVLVLLGFTILFLAPLAAFVARFGKAGRRRGALSLSA